MVVTCTVVFEFRAVTMTDNRGRWGQDTVHVGVGKHFSGAQRFKSV